MLETILEIILILCLFVCVFTTILLFKKNAKLSEANAKISNLERKSQRMREMLMEKIWDADFYREKTEILQEDAGNIEKKYREEIQDLREELLYARLRNTLGTL